MDKRVLKIKRIQKEYDSKITPTNFIGYRPAEESKKVNKSTVEVKKYKNGKKAT